MTIYYITGPDGSGKTTFLESVSDILKFQGKNTIHVWIRSPKIFSKPLMAICRLVGLTKYQYINGVLYGVHEFYRSRLVSYIFPHLQLLDFRIMNSRLKKKININTDCLVIDRHAIDTLADLMVDTGRYDLHKKGVGRRFIKMVPGHSKIIVMKVDEEIIRSRKKDTIHNRHLKNKIEVYDILSKDLDLKVINNNVAMDEVLEAIKTEFDLNERN